jgi:hypothetical protein
LINADAVKKTALGELIKTARRFVEQNKKNHICQLVTVVAKVV